MGLTKQYLRFVPSGVCNIIASSTCNICFVVVNGQEGRFVAVGAAEDVVIWDLRLSEKTQQYTRDSKFLATYIASSEHYLAVGYSDGTVNTFDLRSGNLLQVFPGHRSPISSLAFDPRNLRLASGAKDTEIVVWDLVAESGIQRLSGHKGVVTQLKFMDSRNILVSASKDTFIKFWDLDTNFCFKTLAGHVTEVWSLNILLNDSYVIAGSSDSELRVWKILETTDSDISKIEERLNNLLVGEDTSDVACPIRCEKAGSILCKRRGRVVSMVSDPTRSVLACHGDDKIVELFQFVSDEVTDSRFQKRLKKQRKKSINTEEMSELDNETSPGLRDRVVRLAIIKTDHKIKSVDLIMGRGEEIRVAVLLNNNSVELHSLTVSNTKESQLIRKLTAQGHHSEVRAVAFSSDNLAFVSGAGSDVKVWNRASLTSLRTVPTGYVLSLCFAPGDRHVLAGLKDGKLLIIDIASADVLEEIEAHTSDLNCVTLLPDLTGCITGGGDKTVKVWQFELIPAQADDSDPENVRSKAKVLSLLHLRTLKLEETVLSLRASPDSKLLAVGLLDSTVKIFFLDTFKFFLKLYGHKLPISCLDICDDSTLIVTGSGDRNIKIWGLDFGDCHKSIFAHEDTVTSVVFVPNTHQFFTSGKDGFIKQWDADNFERIITLQGHHGEAWNLAISPNGQYLVSCGQDRVIRLHEITEEPLVLEDERETEREQEEEATLASGQDTVVAGGAALNLPSKKTVAAEKAAELILECLTESEKYRLAAEENRLEGKKPPPLPAIMRAYQVTCLEDELEECLILLPFSSVCQLLELLVPLLKTPHHRTELVVRTLIFLIKVHHGPITSAYTILPTLRKLTQLARERIKELKDLNGTNLYGLLFLQRKIERDEGIDIFTEAVKDRREKDRRKRKREKVAKAAIIAL
ncbi:unnamed protein product [Bemisia tabaci]|uniref:Small-subunit processome Utp12 domain-containing protein n=1 Tax=Bemisia tabaci TaxID=7038 RepID=A0A9P0F3J6_BEMTA|nr:unnamed protein product [Bemisia tabaci]